VRLLGKGELKSKINITVYGASAPAIAAVEAAGGSVTLTAPPVSDEPKGKLQKKVKA
jgi:large subunit ribosomal protein L15